MTKYLLRLSRAAALGLLIILLSGFSTPNFFQVMKFDEYSRNDLASFPVQAKFSIPVTSLSGESTSRIETIDLPESFSAQSLNQLKVYLPPGYDSHLMRRYPVLYLLHGQGDNDNQWVQLGVKTDADRLIDSQEILPLIIVMPNETDSASPEQSGFGETLATALVPWVDAHYRTLPNRYERAIGGLSRGAAWAVRLGLIHWQIFGAIGAHSFPMFYGDGLLIPKWLKAIPTNSYPQIYLDIGSSDPGLGIVTTFENFLTSQGIPHEYHLNVGYHEDKYWGAHLEDYLRWYDSTW